MRHRRSHTHSAHSFVRRHWLIIFIPPLAAALCLLFLAYSNNQQVTAATKLAADQKVAFAKIDAQVKATLQKRIDDARQAEADARASAEADAKVRAAQTALKVPLSSTANATNCAVKSPESLQVVVNKKHCFSPLDWAPSDLVDAAGTLLRAEASTQFQAMSAAATAAGQGFGVSSSYRSYTTQITTYNYWVSISGSIQADTYSARPGYSEHQSGLAVDVKAGSCVLSCFSGSSQYYWLAEHAVDYGFIQRYPESLTSITGYEPEPWHWRYVGTAVAKDMKTKGIQTLEQYYGITGGDYAG
jgi:D-alanyl-D-alanine carboxypeptidase